MEFKFDLAGLFRDFTDERKMFDEVNAVVIWEVTETDRILAARRAMTIDQIEPSTFSSKEIFPGATLNHPLIFSRVIPIGWGRTPSSHYPDSG